MADRGYVARLVAVAGLLTCISATSVAQNAELLAPPIDPAPVPGVPNFNGIWTGPSVLGEEAVRRQLGGDLPPLTPYGLQRWEEKDLAFDPTGYCLPSGPGRALHSPQYKQLVQTPGMVIFLGEIYHQFHRIFTDGRDHPDPLDITWWGSSIGHYEGNKLIVETVGLSERTWLFTAGFQHSEELRLVWVFEKTGPDTIQVTETFDDPVYFTEPWSITYEWTRAEYDMMEYVCAENNRDLNHFVPREAR